MNPDGHRCEAILGDDGEVIAVAHMDPNASDEARMHLRNIVEAARRQFQADVAADPTILERQTAARERIRERNQRLRGES